MLVSAWRRSSSCSTQLISCLQLLGFLARSLQYDTCLALCGEPPCELLVVDSFEEAVGSGQGPVCCEQGAAQLG